MKEKSDVDSAITPDQIKNPEVNRARENPLEEKLGMSPEERIKNLNLESSSVQQEIVSTKELVQTTKLKINEARGNLGMPPTEEDPPSIAPARSKIQKLIEKQILIEEQRAGFGKEGMTATESSGEILGESKSEDNQVDATEKEGTEEQSEVSEGLLLKIAESLRIKEELTLRVEVLKASPEVELFKQKTLILEGKIKKLEELKKPDTSKNSLNIGGSISINGTSNINIEGNINLGSGAESPEAKKEIDLEQEAENLLARTKIEILRLEKEELEYQPESIQIKSGETELELLRVKAETDIWAGGMDEKKFGELLQLINNPETEDQDFESKDLFIKFKEAENNLDLYKEQNIEFYQRIDSKQKEIEAIEKSSGDLECPNERKIMGMLDTKNEDADNKKEEVKEELPSPDGTLGKTATEIRGEGDESKWTSANI